MIVMVIVIELCPSKMKVLASILEKEGLMKRKGSFGLWKA